jgi:hypothetical protein
MVVLVAVSVIVADGGLVIVTVAVTVAMGVIVASGVVVAVFTAVPDGVGEASKVAVLVAPAETTTEPVIVGWIWQWYGKVPGLLKVKLNVWPGLRLPEVQTPLSEVEVCGTWPLFVHRTASPTATLTVAGLKKLSPIDTSMVAWGPKGAAALAALVVRACSMAARASTHTRRTATTRVGERLTRR